MSNRRDSPILRLFGALKQGIGAVQDAEAASDAGLCVVCTKEPVSDPESKICEGCADDAAAAGAEVISRASEDIFRNFIRDTLSGSGRGRRRERRRVQPMRTARPKPRRR